MLGDRATSISPPPSLPAPGDEGGDARRGLRRTGGQRVSSYGTTAPEETGTPAPTALDSFGRSAHSPAGNVDRGDNDRSQHTGADDGDDDEDETNDNEDTAIAALTRRLRCLFAIITWPIVPLGAIVCLALVWLLYAAFVQDPIVWSTSASGEDGTYAAPCSHPLHWYAFVSLALVLYAPYHTRIRTLLFRYVRERDGDTRPPSVRRYDQCFHTLALLYVYGGITLVQTCREDLHVVEQANDNEPEVTVNSCAATCPSLFKALSVYVATVELFTFSLILPLLFLPCIYLWFLRQATADAEALAALHERLQDEDFFRQNDGGAVSADEILQQLEDVKLVRVDAGRQEIQRNGGEQPLQRVFVVPSDHDGADFSDAKDASDVKECCICMSEFQITVDPHRDADDIETGGSGAISAGDVNVGGENSDRDGNEAIVRTISCGHLFHKHCIASWVGGRWQRSNAVDESSPPPRRRARRTTCPLCRNDLRPPPG